MSASHTSCDTLPQILSRQAAANPGAPALLFEEKTFTYGELQQRAESLARRLRRECAPGERVAVLAWNSPAFVELIYAVAAAGAVLVPLNARLAATEWVCQLRHTDCTLLFGEADLLQALEEHEEFPEGLTPIALDDSFQAWHDDTATETLPDIAPEDPAWILYTSGSTGRPKGAVLTHRAFIAGLRSAALARPVEASDRYFYPFPLFHVAAHNVLLQHLHGAAVVLARSFDATETLHACRELGVSTMSLAPTMIAMLLDHPDFRPQDLAGVRTIGYGASAMPEVLLQRLLRETNVGLCQSYGMTELCGSVAFLTVEDHVAAARQPHLLQSVGKPLPTAEIRIEGDSGEPGEILVRAEQCMAGYWRDDEATREAIRDGWLHTGDIGRFDQDGNLYIVDRKKDIIISGGENVASREVEEILHRHPAVKDCAVIGLPDNKWGEAVCAVLVLHRSVDFERLEQHCRSLFAGYKTPKRWFITDALPLNASGKIDKPLLRKRYAENAQR